MGLAPRAAAGPPLGVQLIVAPQSLSFQKVTAGMPAVAAQPPLSIQVLAPGQQPWRLTVMALGPLQSVEGAQIPSQQVSWHGSPAPVFMSGTLRANRPQLVARGQGSKAGVLQFILKNRWEFAEGTYSQRLLFTLSSP